MARSVLLQIARDSIQEVLQAKNSIDKKSLIATHPLLNEKMPITVNIYLNNELRGSSNEPRQDFCLLDGIIKHAKKSAFEDINFSPLSTSEYLNCEVEIILNSPDGIISEKDPAILSYTHQYAK